MQNKKRIGCYLTAHYAGLALLMFVLTFFLIPFHVFLSFSRYSEMIREHVAQNGELSRLLAADMRMHFSSLLNMQNQEMMSFGFAAMGYFTGIFLFRHLFTGKRTVLEASLPVKKTSDFLLRTLVYVLDSLLPAALALALIPVLAGLTGMQGYLSGRVYTQCGILLLMHVYGYAAGVLSAALTGQLWACAAVTAVLTAGAEGLLCCWRTVAIHYLYTMPRDAAVKILRTHSPAFSLYKTLFKPEQFAPTAGIVAIVLFLVLAAVLYRYRAPERTGHPLAFAGLEVPGMILASLVCGSFAGMVFMNILDSEAALLVALVAGAVLGFVLFRGLISFNMRKAFTALPLGIGCAFVLILAVLVLRFDLVGYDRYLPDAEGITTVFIQAEGEDGIPQKVTLTNEEAVRAACTIGRQMREVTVGKKGYHSTAFDSFIVEYRSKGSLHRRNYSDRRNAAGMPDPEAYCAAAKTLVESEEFRRDTIASLHLDEFEEALDQFDEKSNVGRISVYAYLQSYGPSVEKWANAPDFRGGGGEMFTENAPDRVRHLLRVIRETVMKRTVETMGQNPVCTFQLDGRGVDRYLSATVRVYPGETELLSVWLGEQAERAEQLLTGGFTSVCACEVYRLHYDTPDFTDGNDPLSRGNPASITKAGSPEEAEKWIRNSISGNGMERYYAPEISQDEIWLFETDNYPEGYGIASGSETQMPEGVELLEQIRENPELYYLAKRRYLIAGR